MKGGHLPMDEARITALHVYPVKSCRGIALDSAIIGEAGITGDRRWMIATPEGRFVTQRELPALAMIATEQLPEGLRLTAPDGSCLTVSYLIDGERRRVRVWNDDCLAFDAGESASAWLHAKLGQPLRLCQFDPSTTRPSDPIWADGIRSLNEFSDGFPILVACEASLADLNARLLVPIPMNRFRPNLVLGGIAAWDEDRLHEIAIGALRIRILKPCTRCRTTTIDQSTGEPQGTEPLATLKASRWSDELKGVLFGQNAAVGAGAGTRIAVGDRVSLSWRTRTDSNRRPPGSKPGALSN